MPKEVLSNDQRNFKKKEARTHREGKKLRYQGNTMLTVRGYFQKKLEEQEEISAKVEKSSLPQDI